MKKILFLFFALISYFSACAMINYVGLIDKSLVADPNHPFNGVFLVAKEDEILYQKASAEYGEPKLESQFIIGELKEQFIATVVMQLADQKLLNIHQSIRHYLPEYKKQSANKITIKMLLSHEYEGLDGYAILIKIIEQVSGKTIKELLDGLFKRVGMKASAFIAEINLQDLYSSFPNLAHGHLEEKGGIMPATLLNDEYNIISTASDLFKWNLALHGNALISSESYKIMTAISKRKVRPDKVNYGFGLGLLEKNDKDKELQIGAKGLANGYVSTLIYYPKSKISVVVLENILWEKQAFKVQDEIVSIMSTVSSLVNFYNSTK